LFLPRAIEVLAVRNDDEYEEKEEEERVNQILERVGIELPSRYRSVDDFWDVLECEEEHCKGNVSQTSHLIVEF